jgi:hypothetical protein
VDEASWGPVLSAGSCWAGAQGVMPHVTPAVGGEAPDQQHPMRLRSWGPCVPVPRSAMGALPHDAPVVAPHLTAQKHGGRCSGLP